MACLELVTAAILSLNPGFSNEKAERLAKPICKESKKNEIDPLVAVAIIQHESNWRSRTVSTNRNGSKDYGLMQFNCPNVIKEKRRIHFCANRSKLLEIDQNIAAGIWVLKSKRSSCLKKHYSIGILLTEEVNFLFAVSYIPWGPLQGIRHLILEKHLKKIAEDHWWIQHYNWNSDRYFLKVLYIYVALKLRKADSYSLIRDRFYTKLLKKKLLRKCVIDNLICVEEYRKWQQRKKKKRQ